MAFELSKMPMGGTDVDLASDFLRLDPFGRVPLLELDDGSTLREAPAIMQFVADLCPETQLIPPCGSAARARMNEWLHFLSCDIHHRTIFPPHSAALKTSLVKRFAWVNLQLATRPFLLGAQYTIADIYFWAIWSWTPGALNGTPDFPNIERWYLRIASRQSVRAALEAER